MGCYGGVIWEVVWSCNGAVMGCYGVVIGGVVWSCNGVMGVIGGVVWSCNGVLWSGDGGCSMEL